MMNTFIQKILPLLIFAGFSLYSVPSLAQNSQENAYEVQYRSRSYIPIENTENFIPANFASAQWLNKGEKVLFILMQMHNIPTQEEVASIKKEGIELLEYIPSRAYFAALPASITGATLERIGVRAIDSIVPGDKISPLLQQENLPEWIQRDEGKVEVLVHVFRNTLQSETQEALRQYGKVLYYDKYVAAYSIFTEATAIEDIANLPFVMFVEEAPAPQVEENRRSRGRQGAALLRAAEGGGRNLTGLGIRIGMWDGGEVGEHLDFANRLTMMEQSNYSSHATHCLGTAGGGGLFNERHKGMAPLATLFAWDFAGPILTEMRAGVENQNIDMSTNSYGSQSPGSPYNSNARALDILVNDYPTFSHIHSAGNSGSNFSTITGAGNGKPAKNNIVVGSINTNNDIAGSSSRGPIADGRLKPEITAIGVSVTSTVENNQYTAFSGTSMATPGVAGTLALIYERYTQLFNGTRPPAALVRGLVCNTADDLGNSGPDFIFGFGALNAGRAVNALENEWYKRDTLTQGQTKSHTVTLPSGTHQLRIMLAYSDKEAATNAAPALVNNLDVRLISSGQDTTLPWVLNPATPSAVAVRGIDALNNIEQITLNTPAAGTYTIEVSGTAVPFGPQEFFVTWDIIEPHINLVYPAGGERFTPGQQEVLRWDAFGISGNQTVQLSLDSGSTWSNINTSVNVNQRFFNWTPQTSHIGGSVLFRVSAGAFSTTSTVPVSIVGIPTFSVDTSGMTPVVNIQSVSGAVGYEVLALTTTADFQVIGSTATTSFVLDTLEVGSTAWVTVRAVLSNGRVGMRATPQQVFRKFPYTISGRITAPGGGNPLSPAAISIVVNNSDTVAINPDGTYSIGVLPGSYTLTPLSVLDHQISPASLQVTVSNSSIGQRNFTATLADPLVLIGIGTNANSSTSYPAPYGNYYWGARHQMLILAEELADQGLEPGDTLLSLAFDVASLNNGAALNNYRLGLLNTQVGTLTGTLTGLTEVLAPTTYTPTLGWNTHNFTTPFVWNGNNLVVEVCFQNNSFRNDGNASTRFSVISGFVPVRFERADNGTVCGTNVGRNSQNRPNMLFSFGRSELFTLSGSIFGAVQTGVTVSLSGQGSVTTVGNGSFEFDDVPSGTYTITPTLAGFVFDPPSREVTVSQTTGNISGLDFVSSAQTYSLSGTISGVTQAGVTISLNGSFSIITDANGNFTFTDLPNGSYSLIPSAPGFIFTPPTRSVQILNSNVTGQNFVSAVPTYSVTGVVEGAVQEGVEITLDDGSNQQVELSNSGGRFSFEGLSNGTYVLTPSLIGYDFTPTSHTVVINGGNVFDKDFTAMHATFVVSGTVTGAAVEGVLFALEASGITTTTSTLPNGTFAFPSVTNGIYQLTPSLVGYRFTPTTLSVEVQNGDVQSLQFQSLLLQDTILIPIATGWNMVSSYVSAATMEMESLLSSNSSIFLMKNNAGGTFLPTLGINQIGDWEITQGYQVYSDDIDTLKFIGQAKTSVPIPIAQGWNMVAYLRTAPLSISEALAGIEANLLLVKNNEGEVFIPQFGINGIGQMMPGQGYQLFSTAATVLTYPAGIRSLVEEKDFNELPRLRYLTNESITGYGATLIVRLPYHIDGEVGAYTSRGSLIGAGVVQQGIAAFHLRGADEFSSWAAEEGEEIALHFVTAQSSRELLPNKIHSLLTKEELPTLRYFSDEVLLAQTSAKTSYNHTAKCSPNPANDNVQVTASLEGQKATLRLFDALGRTLLEDTDIPLRRGQIEHNFSVRNFSPGAYTVEVYSNTGEKVFLRLLVVR